MRRNMRFATFDEISVARVFAEDKNYGCLLINEVGDIYAFIDGKPIQIYPEKGGRNGKELLIRWIDKSTGIRKKAYIKKLMKDYF